MNSDLPIDSYEIIRLVSWSRPTQTIIFFSIVVGTLAIFVFAKRQKVRKRYGVIGVLTVFTGFVSIVLLVPSSKKHYALSLLSSESDRAAALGCRYLAGVMTVQEFQMALSNPGLAANTRYYLAAALILKSPDRAFSVLEKAPQFEEPLFFSSNGINDKDGIMWPVSGSELFSNVTRTLGKN